MTSLVYEEEECEQSYSIKLMKTKFSRTINFRRPITMLPQLDINLHFIFQFSLSEWAESIKYGDDEPTLALVRQSRRGPLIKNVVKRSLMQFSSYKQTGDAIGQVLRRCLPDLDDEDGRDMIEYAIVNASEIIKSKPVGDDALDLYFCVSAQYNRVIPDRQNSNQLIS